MFMGMIAIKYTYFSIVKKRFALTARKYTTCQGPIRNGRLIPRVRYKTNSLIFPQ